MTSDKKINVINVVWGEKYTDIFLGISLPSQLSPNNLQALRNAGITKYTIYTTQQDEIKIRSHPTFKRLENLIETQINAEVKTDFDSKFTPLMKFHNQSIIEADDKNAAMLFLSPDFVLADGTFKRIVELQKQGYHAILILTLRLVREQAMPEFIGRFYSEDNCSLCASPRELVNLGFQFLHPIEKSYYYGPAFSSFPIHAYWKVADEGLIARCFYLHPIFVNPEIKGVVPRITVDADYIDRSCPNRSKIYVVRDSDDISCFELSDQDAIDMNAASRPNFKPTAWNYARWATVNANPVFPSTLHHWYFQLPIKVHKNDLSAKWENIERRSLKIAQQINYYTTYLRMVRGLRYYGVRAVRNYIGLLFRWYLQVFKYIFFRKFLFNKTNYALQMNDWSKDESDFAGIDMGLYRYHQKYFTDLYSSLLAKYLKSKNITDLKKVDVLFDESFPKLNLKNRSRVKISFNEIFFGTGWDRPKSDKFGRCYRRIGATGQSSVFMKLKTNADYVLKCHFAEPLKNTALLEIKINEIKITDLTFIDRYGELYVYAILPVEYISEKGGIVKIDFCFDAAGLTSKIAFSMIDCWQFKRFDLLFLNRIYRRKALKRLKNKIDKVKELLSP